MSIFVIPGFFRKKQFYASLVNKFQESGFNTEIIDLGYNTRNLQDSSEKVLDYLENTSDRYSIVAHSYGGLILKYTLQNCPKLRKEINSLIFVSVPHSGCWTSLFISIFPAARDGLPFRKHLKELSRVELPKKTVNFLPQKGLKVWPRKGILLEKYLNVIIPNTNHDNIVKNEDFISKAIGFLQTDFNRVFLS